MNPNPKIEGELTCVAMSTLAAMKEHHGSAYPMEPRATCARGTGGMSRGGAREGGRARQLRRMRTRNSARMSRVRRSRPGGPRCWARIPAGGQARAGRIAHSHPECGRRPHHPGAGRGSPAVAGPAGPTVRRVGRAPPCVRSSGGAGPHRFSRVRIKRWRATAAAHAGHASRGAGLGRQRAGRRRRWTLSSGGCCRTNKEREWK